jgi:hypothetical protein
MLNLMKWQKSKKLVPINLRVMLKIGLIAPVMLLSLLSGCANVQRNSVIPDYKSEFFECVAHGIENNIYHPCTYEALADWEVMTR